MAGAAPLDPLELLPQLPLELLPELPLELLPQLPLLPHRRCTREYLCPPQLPLLPLLLLPQLPLERLPQLPELLDPELLDPQLPELLEPELLDPQPKAKASPTPSAQTVTTATAPINRRFQFAFLIVESFSCLLWTLNWWTHFEHVALMRAKASHRPHEDTPA